MTSTFDSIYALIEDSSPLEVAVVSAVELLVKQRIYDWFFFLFFSFFFLPFYFPASSLASRVLYRSCWFGHTYVE